MSSVTQSEGDVPNDIYDDIRDGLKHTGTKELLRFKTAHLPKKKLMQNCKSFYLSGKYWPQSFPTVVTLKFQSKLAGIKTMLKADLLK